MSAEEHEFLLGLIRRHKLPGTHLEVGTAAGGTLWQMMQCFEDGHRPRFAVVDPMTYFPDQLEQVKRNLRDHGLDPGEVDFRVTTSAGALAAATRNREVFDFILIDASHKVMSVTGDLRWTRLLRVGGILCLHDYSPEHRGVLVPARRFAARHAGYEPLGCGGTVIALRKTADSARPEIGLGDWLHALLWYLPLQFERKFVKRRRHARVG